MSFFVEGVTQVPDGKTRARRIGEYWTHDEAVAAARQIIDAFLYREYRLAAGRGITAEKLLAHYRGAGEVPYILRDSETSTNVSSFNHLEYAARRCAEICGGDAGAPR
jgi:hypothetical protein